MPQASAPVSSAAASAATSSGQPKDSPAVGVPAPTKLTVSSAM